MTSHQKSLALFLALALIIPLISVQAQNAGDTGLTNTIVLPPIDQRFPENKPIEEVGETVGNFKLITRLEKQRFKPQEPINFEMALKNVGETSTRLIRAEPLQNFEVKMVRFVDGKATPQGVPLTLYGQQQVANSRTFYHRRSEEVKSGEEKSDTIDLKRVFDLSMSGSYQATVSSVVGDKDKWVDIQSKPIDLEIER